MPPARRPAVRPRTAGQTSQPQNARLAAGALVLAALGGGWLVVRDNGAPAVPAALPTIASSTTVAPTVPTVPTAPTAPTVVATVVDADRVPAPLRKLVAGVPVVQAAAYVVYDASTNTIIATKAATAKRPVASIIKLLTAEVVLRDGPLEDPVVVPPMKVGIKESQIGLRAGEKLTRAILTRAMLIVSANDASRALAIDVAGSEGAFVAEMNATAKAIGMVNTVAKNSIGLDQAGAYSTAEDVLTLARTLMRDADIRAAVARRNARLHGHVYPATNKLLGVLPGADGIKTGHTTGAGYSIVASATRSGRQIYVVLLGAPTDVARQRGTTALINWAFDQ